MFNYSPLPPLIRALHSALPSARLCARPGSLTFCQPEDNAGLLTGGENRERSFPRRAEAEHSPSCCRCCLIWGPRSCSVLSVMGLALKLCDRCLQQAQFFTPLSFLGAVRHFQGLFNFLPHEAPVQKREMPFSLKCLNSRDTLWRGWFLLFF